MDKGIYFIADKNGNPIIWKNDKFFTEEEIQHYIKTGKPKDKDLSMLFPVFSEGWMALQYSIKRSVQDIQVGQVTNQEVWTYILDILRNNNVKTVITNPCIKDIVHECMLLTWEIDKITDFESFDSTMKNIESFDEKCGYSVNDLKK